MTARPSPAARLRAAMANGIVMAPGAADALTARLIERAGFPAVYMTGFGATAGRLGLPDLGLMTQTEMTEHARIMVRAVGLPVVADADTGYGGPANIHRTVREYVQAGVAAIHLEDQVAPKRCGQLAGIRLVDAEENARRLACAIEARGDDDLLVIGRTDALPAAGLDEAVRRAALYREAGVDLVFVDGVKRIAEVEAIARAVPGPKVVSIVDGNETVALTASDLQAMGFSLVFYALSTLFSAVRAMEDTLAVLKRDGTPRARADAMTTYGEFAALVDLAGHQARADRFGG
ncbi:isocitrate lyase/PEP mutase family protein [Methylobacterium platani]|uniref:2,3-dimethylmalate lyase n=2 Tax=Methylobacterium platani TaxID=427683 RepID=A0A179S3B8_9HYPH|nr:isocitrate lyase/PEP mutase family protein [Methylobacterium platani]KMO18449.1 2,3-dimethylmalate lyase [Methylobacterium platani JCM 14648]OAS20264.1 2,3-dimethylmalate lyase [Methylobacterium platani]